MWKLLKKEDKSWLSLIKFWQIFNQLLDQKLKNLVVNFFGINMRSLYAKFQLPNFKTRRWRSVKMQNFKQPQMEQKIYIIDFH